MSHVCRQTFAGVIDLSGIGETVNGFDPLGATTGGVRPTGRATRSGARELERARRRVEWRREGIGGDARRCGAAGRSSKSALGADVNMGPELINAIVIDGVGGKLGASGIVELRRISILTEL